MGGTMTARATANVLAALAIVAGAAPKSPRKDHVLPPNAPRFRSSRWSAASCDMMINAGVAIRTVQETVARMAVFLPRHHRQHRRADADRVRNLQDDDHDFC